MTRLSVVLKGNVSDPLTYILTLCVSYLTVMQEYSSLTDQQSCSGMFLTIATKIKPSY